MSGPRPGRTHDITAARHDHIVEHLKAAGLGALADLGFLGLDKDCNNQVVVTGYKATRARKLTTGQKTANRIIAAGRAPVEHGFAHLRPGASSPNSARAPPAPPTCSAPCSS
ncbi:transposase family protein [Streptomyces mirabilis]|uniref:transposase family protein n=1 Tax=Streptomyces mirabilis TaxID=68239 RepID=UPI0033D14CD9